MIYTGGTIGMTMTDRGLAPYEGYLEEQVMKMDEISGNPRVPMVDILRWDTLVDSSNMDPASWALLARQIEEYYFHYDGFVILHGTDTMAYTASALSFILENLGKPVVLTGSQIPFCEVYNDARRNLLVSAIFAGLTEIPEVSLFFDQHLFRGNRSKKVDSRGLSAFETPNFPPLATLQNNIHIRHDLVRKQPNGRLRVHPYVESNIAVLHMVPGFDDAFLQALTGSNLDGLILHLYGTGNAPSKKASFLKAISDITDGGTAVVAISQCARGAVNMEQYEVGVAMKEIGVMNGNDMTVEAACTKLGYLLTRGLSQEVFKSAVENSLRGELSTAGERDGETMMPSFFKDEDKWYNL